MSLSNPTNSVDPNKYGAQIYPDGTVTCGCPDFTTRKRRHNPDAWSPPAKLCKHLIALRFEMKINLQPLSGHCSKCKRQRHTIHMYKIADAPGHWTCYDCRLIPWDEFKEEPLMSDERYNELCAQLGVNDLF